MKLPQLLLLTASIITAPVVANEHTVERVRLATTTSTYHSGLLDYLLPSFTIDTGYQIDVIAAGTGKSLKMGQNGDVDIVMTHAPEAEARFVEAGYGIQPRKVMYNDFVIVGPKNDPANVSQSSSIKDVFSRIANKNALFVSRGDDSGTNIKELQIWDQTQIAPEFPGYRSVGQGMGPTLNMASEIQGYTMTDRGTWLAYQAKLDLAILFEGDEHLFNPYQVILVSPKRYSDINVEGAQALSNWLVSKKGQKMINSYRKMDQQLFVANAE
ncbi:substrate-binding domain-containing protein [Vibrio sp. ZSDZ34]|jgi:tungstate transport system substrate-binding protein|uniref:Substrate-binding domain-containing protein n=1 Tax=Vibrio gelatinilyticus TaxID=2893468 RepID=A0A9X1W8Z5_9VIBR|nr:substrate-binding domain-containing protein [Vibrio gelatinilyticus]MCJ2376562.1 substrate-binding domain-containing protein [Vibrio gelatinilyticus]